MARQDREPKEFGDMDDLEERLGEWTPDQLRCRVRGHNYEPLKADDYSLYGLMVQHWECSRCGAQQTEDLGTRGENMGARLKTPYTALPKGYQNPPGMGRFAGPERNRMRIELGRVMFKGKIRRVADDEAATQAPRSEKVRSALGIEA